MPPRGIGGAEKRFLQVSNRWVEKYGMTMYTIEVAPGLAGSYESYKVRLPFNMKYAFFTSLIRGGLWLPAAIVLGLIVGKLRRVELVFVPVNSITNVLPAFIVHRMLRLPWVVTYPFPDLAEISNTFFAMFRNYVSKMRAFEAIVQTIASCLGISCMTRATRIITNGPKSLLIRMGIPSDRVSVTINGVDSAYYSCEDQPLNKRYDAVYIGRLTPEKGIIDLVHVWKRVVRSRPEALLVVVGSGRRDFTATLKGMIARADLTSNVILLGFVSDADAKRVLLSARVFVYLDTMTAVYPFPSSVLEAMSCGIPVVTYNTFNRIGEKQDASTCLGVRLVSVGHIDDVAKEIVLILSDRTLARDIGMSARSFAKDYTWDKVAAFDYNVLLSACSRFPKSFHPHHSSPVAKLDDRKIRWIIHEKQRGTRVSELALIQGITPRCVKQL
jgi:glycosyltransferase involved in cell wall biosynthesis